MIASAWAAARAGRPKVCGYRAEELVVRRAPGRVEATQVLAPGQRPALPRHKLAKLVIAITGTVEQD
jgi:hypothetical protein